MLKLGTEYIGLIILFCLKFTIKKVLKDNWIIMYYVFEFAKRVDLKCSNHTHTHTHTHTHRNGNWEVTNMLISLTVVIISQYKHMSKYNIVF